MSWILWYLHVIRVNHLWICCLPWLPTAPPRRHTLSSPGCTDGTSPPCPRGSPGSSGGRHTFHQTLCFSAHSSFCCYQSTIHKLNIQSISKYLKQNKKIVKQYLRCKKLICKCTEIEQKNSNKTRIAERKKSYYSVIFCLQE